MPKTVPIPHGWRVQPRLTRGKGTGPCHTLALLALGLLLAGCDRPSVPYPPSAAALAPWLEEITDAAGIRFAHDPGARGDYRMPEHIGSGCALFDYDNDGRLDLFLIQNGGPGSGSLHQLYHQESDGTFRNASEGSGLDLESHGMGAAIGDVNNDGWRDLLLTEFGQVRLFLNQAGSGRFLDVTEASGLVNPRWATAAAFFDYDRDGWLDLMVANYIDFDPTHPCYDSVGRRDYCGPERAPPTLSRLFRNLGPPPDQPVHPPRFEDVTLPSGLIHHPGQALGLVCLDFNGDTWPDMLVADDEIPNRLFINQTDGTFREEGALRGLAYTALGQVAADMGIAIGDVDGNGLFDVFITHLDKEFHNLWLQEKQGAFQDRTAEFGLTQPAWRSTGFGTVLVDFDLDGDLDLALVNGRIKRRPGPVEPLPPNQELAPFWIPYAEPSQIFQNNGQGRFTDISTSNPDFGGPRQVGRGLAWGDLNNDGAPDLVMTAIGGPARVFRNVAGLGHHWLLVEAVDPKLGGRDMHGAEIRLQTDDGRFWGVVLPGSSYLSSHDPRVHFGLGHRSRYTSIEVLWPDGSTELFPGGPADRILRLSKGSGQSPAAR